MNKLVENVNTKITEVAYYPIKPTERGLIGFCSCLFDGRLALQSIAIYVKSNGEIRLVFPNTHLANGKQINVYYPIDSQTYEAIRSAIEEKIENVTKEVIGEKIDADNRN